MSHFYSVRTYTYIHIYIHTYIHTYIHKYIHTYIVKYTLVYIYSQLGILIPAGTPLEPNAKTSSDVKSGHRNLSFSKSLGQGRRVSKDSADSTNLVNFLLIVLLTTATKPDEYRI